MASTTEGKFIEVNYEWTDILIDRKIYIRQINRMRKL